MRNLVSVASCSTCCALARTTSFNGTGEASSEKFVRTSATNPRASLLMARCGREMKSARLKSKSNSLVVYRLGVVWSDRTSVSDTEESATIKVIV